MIWPQTKSPLTLLFELFICFRLTSQSRHPFPRQGALFALTSAAGNLSLLVSLPRSGVGNWVMALGLRSLCLHLLMIEPRQDIFSDRDMGTDKNPIRCFAFF